MFVFHRLYLWLTAAGVRSMTEGVGGTRLTKAPAKVTGAKLQRSHGVCRDENRSPLISPRVILGVSLAVAILPIRSVPHATNKCSKHRLVFY